MKKLLLFLSIIGIFNFTNSFSQTGWINYPTGVSTSFRDIYFVNANTGWIVGDTIAVFKSTNGGINWFKQDITYPYTNYSQFSLKVIKFLNETTGFVAGGHDTPMNGYYYNYIFKTTNGGNNWVNIYNSGSNSFINNMFLIDENTFYRTNEGWEGLAVTTGGVYKTTNGGINFNLCVSYGQSQTIYFINPNTGWANSYYATDAGGNKGWILKTTNAGLNWIIQHKDSMANATQINRIQFFDINTGYAVGHGSNGQAKFIKTTNGGLNWSFTSYSHGRDKTMFFTDQNTGWIGGASYPDSSCISYTSNGGVNWTSQKKNYNGLVYNVYFINNLTGWASLCGNILKTTNGGITFVKQTSLIEPNYFQLYQNYPNPFNPVTKIKFDIVLDSRFRGNDNTVLKVFDITGKEVATLVNEALQPGMYDVTFDGNNIAAGIYFYQLRGGEFIETKKMVLIK